MKNHHAQIDIYVAPLLFSWPRSGSPTFLILESPLFLTERARLPMGT